MNILFIEDDCELRGTGVVQLESHGYVVYPVTDLVEARAVIENPAMPVKLVIADQHLPDGQVIHFIIELKSQFPDCMYVVVSDCLMDQNIRELQEYEIPYYQKPLLYYRLVEELRLEHLLSAPHGVRELESPAPPPLHKGSSRKRWFGLFGRSVS